MIDELPTFGAYRAERLLGSGSFADVYLCYHADLDTRVAVKVLHPHLSRQEEICQRFLQEAQILWRADHDRVIQVTHVDEASDGRPYFVMRHADRGSLNDLVDERSSIGEPLTLAETVGYAVELAACLDVLRDRGVVHRDLKPSNVLVKSIRTADARRADRYGLPANERLVLADFGLAKRLSDGTNLISHLGGTPWYMAPELTSLTASVDWRADLFSVGVVAYELANTQVPWPERRWEHVREVDDSLVNSAETRPDLPAEFDEVIRRAVQPDPMDRFDSPSEFAEALDSLLDLEAAAEPGDEDEVLGIVVAARQAVSEPAARLVADQALHRLQAPLRISLVGGTRVGPGSFALTMAGERLSPTGGGAVGSVVTRINAGDRLRIRALTAADDPVEGTLTRDPAGRLELSVPAAPWSITSLNLELDSPDLAERELIDIPHAVVRRDPTLARSLIDGCDVVIVGLPTSIDGGDIAHREIQAVLDQCSVGPVAVLGVRQPASSAAAGETEHWSQILPADDTTELHMYLDELVRGPVGSAVRSSGALALAGHALTLDDRADALRARFDALSDNDDQVSRFLALRTAHLIAYEFEPDEFIDVRSMLGGTSLQSRLRHHADTDRAIDTGLAHWEAALGGAGLSSRRRFVSEQMAQSYRRLKHAGGNRPAAPAWTRLFGGTAPDPSRGDQT